MIHTKKDPHKLNLTMRFLILFLTCNFFIISVLLASSFYGFWLVSICTLGLSSNSTISFITSFIKTLKSSLQLTTFSILEDKLMIVFIRILPIMEEETLFTNN
jgi:hypothetical protein